MNKYKGLPKKNYKLWLLSSIAGLALGHIYGRIRSEPYNTQNLTPYQCEDQINHILDTTKKPVVIYYYHPFYSHHRIVRKEFLKFSNLYPNRATWIMASYKQHSFHINSNTGQLSKELIMLQIKFPKQELLDAKEGLSNSLQIYPTEYFKGNPYQIKQFLQRFAVIEVNDGVQPLREVAQLSLFGKVFTK